ncbi:MAG TPA: sugar ABC transporter substrate-binding protein [Polyangiaceae bacterium]|nr:sugar ABC transporter substrate-binding protein [Polyangiaceae bacterium]
MTICRGSGLGAFVSLALGVFGANLGCSRPDSSAIELWAAGREGEVVAELIPGFESSHPGLHVRVQQMPWLGAHEKLLTSVVAESTPDIAPLGNTWVAEFAVIGALEPLDDRVSRSELIRESDYFAGAWETNRFANTQYGVPWYVDTRLLFYRRDLLAEAGFEQPPQTWDEWRAMMSALRDRFDARREPRRAPLYLPVHEPEPLIALALQQGDPLLRDGDRFGNFRSAGFRRALDFYAGLFRDRLAPKIGVEIGNLYDEFARGNFVFYIGGPWQLGEFARRLPRELQGSWATAPLPGRDGAGSSLAFGSSLVVFSGSKKKDASYALIEYLSRPDVQRHFYELTGDLPPRRASWQGPELSVDDRTAAFRSQLERIEPTPAVPEWERIMAEIKTVGEMTARGRVGVDQAAAELDARTDQILEKRRWLLEQPQRAAGTGTHAREEAR